MDDWLSVLISLAWTLVFLLYSEWKTHSISSFLTDPARRAEIIDQLASSIFVSFKASLMGQASGVSKKHAAISAAMRDSMKQVLPEVAAELWGNPLLGRLVTKVLTESTLGEYLDENPQDLFLVLEQAQKLLSNISSPAPQVQQQQQQQARQGKALTI